MTPSEKVKPAPTAIEVGKQLKVTRLQARAGWVLRLEGAIDETFQPGVMLHGLSGWVVVEMHDVTRITSFGVREWTIAFKKLGQQVAGIVFTRCPPWIVAQFNMVTDFASGGLLVSFDAPYLCPDCGEEVNASIDLRHQRDAVIAMDLPSVQCPNCHKEAEFDDLPEAYFQYASMQPPLDLPAAAQELIDNPSVGSAGMTPVGLRIEKRVFQSVTELIFSGLLDERASLKRIASGLEGLVVLDLGAVTLVTQAGVARMESLLSASDIRFGLTRVSASYIQLAASAEAPALVRASLQKISSVRLPFRCRDGHLEELTRSAEPIVDPTQIAPTCRLCGASTVLDVESKALAVLEGIRLLPLSAEVIACLNRGEQKTETIARQAASAADRYEIQQRIGSGGMAEIFLARQRGPEGFDRKVALKKILPHLCAQPGFLEMFLQEARVAAKLSHPNIVQIIELGQMKDSYFIAMEYIRGWDLQDIILAAEALNVHLPIELGLRICSDVAGALSAAHEFRDDQGNSTPVVHRDVSPHNILISENGVVKLTDFGIAKAEGQLAFTQAGTVRGKCAYLSPERILDQVGPLDPRPDLFSVGVMLVVCLTRKHPFAGSNDLAIMKAILDSPVPSLRAVRPELPVSVEEMVLRTVEKDPNQRYQTALQLQAAIEKGIFEVGRPASAAQLGAWLGTLMRKGKSIDGGPADLTRSAEVNGEMVTKTKKMVP